MSLCTCFEVAVSRQPAAVALVGGGAAFAPRVCVDVLGSMQSLCPATVAIASRPLLSPTWASSEEASHREATSRRALLVFVPGMGRGSSRDAAGYPLIRTHSANHAFATGPHPRRLVLSVCRTRIARLRLGCIKLRNRFGEVRLGVSTRQHQPCCCRDGQANALSCLDRAYSCVRPRLGLAFLPFVPSSSMPELCFRIL